MNGATPVLARATRMPKAADQEQDRQEPPLLVVAQEFEELGGEAGLLPAFARGVFAGLGSTLSGFGRSSAGTSSQFSEGSAE